LLTSTKVFRIFSPQDSPQKGKREEKNVFIDEECCINHTRGKVRLQKKPQIRKCLAIGIILLSVGANVSTVGSSIQKKMISTEDTPEIDFIPNEGLYWNDQKIAEYHVTLYLHYYFKFKAIFYPRFITHNISGIFMVEFYVDGSLIGSVSTEPFEFYCRLIVTPFRHSSTYGIKIYYGADQSISDNMTIYRLFP
jgi:hypothetical protein